MSTVPSSHAAMRCHHHPDQSAGWFCHRCGQALCHGCVNRIRAREAVLTTCRACRGPVAALATEDPADAAHPDDANFYLRLHESVIYPLRGANWIMLLAATIGFWVAGFFTFLPLVGVLVALFMAMYLNAYSLKVIQQVGAGEKEMPDWPDLSDLWDEIVRPALLVLGAYGLAFLPLLGVFIYYVLDEEGLAMWSAMGWAVLYLPMALAAVGWSESFEGLNPILVIRSILRVPLQYAVAVALLLGLLWLEGPVGAFAESLPFGGLLYNLFYFYFLFVELHLLGLLIHANYERLGWVA